MGVIGNRQGLLPDYPEYTNEYIGVGGKLYRQGLIKMSEFVTHCGRDRVPIIWFQDTSGIDVGDIAEKSELLGLGQSLIYSIEQTELAMMLVVLRKGTAAAHYVLGGPTANNNNAFTLGTPATEIYVMHGETAAAASYSRRLVKEKDAGRPLGPIIEKMNEMVDHYRATSHPLFCAKEGFVDEIIRFEQIRNYMVALRKLCIPESTINMPPPSHAASAIDTVANREGTRPSRGGIVKKTADKKNELPFTRLVLFVLY